MTRRLISSGSTFEEQIGYSRAVVDGEWIFVSGTTGFDYATMTISEDVVEQAEQTIANITAGARRSGRQPCRRRTSPIPAAGRCGLRAVLAGAPGRVRGDRARRNDDAGRSLGPTDAHRDRGDGADHRLNGS